MACEKWGNGSKWGDGSKWCRELFSSPYIAISEAVGHYLSCIIRHTTNATFIIAGLRLIASPHARRAWTYYAPFDAIAPNRISIIIRHHTNANFIFKNAYLDSNIKKHRG